MKKPLLSVVVPLGNGRSFPAKECLQKQDMPIEVIVEVGPNPSANRNNGARKARASLVAFINGHSLPAPDWARKVVAFFENHKEVDIAGGSQLTALDAKDLEHMIGYAVSSKFGSAASSNRYAGNRLIRDADERHITSANLICRASVLSNVLFDESLWPGEDPKFIADAKVAKYSIVFTPELSLYHRRRTTVKDFAEQIFKYGAVRPRKESFIETCKKPQFLVPSLFLAYLIFLVPLSLLIHPIFTFPAILYLCIVIILGMHYSFAEKNSSGLVAIPFLFFVLHVSYGVGFIAGFFRRGL